MGNRVISESINIRINVGNYQHIEIVKQAQEEISFKNESERISLENSLTNDLVDSLIRSMKAVPERLGKGVPNAQELEESISKAIPEWLDGNPPNLINSTKEKLNKSSSEQKVNKSKADDILNVTEPESKPESKPESSEDSDFDYFAQKVEELGDTDTSSLPFDEKNEKQKNEKQNEKDDSKFDLFGEDELGLFDL